MYVYVYVGQHTDTQQAIRDYCVRNECSKYQKLMSRFDLESSKVIN